MDIEREFNLTSEDFLNFQQYQFKAKARKNSWFNLLQWLMGYLPLLFIIFSSAHIFDYGIKTMGLIIVLGLCTYHILIYIFSKRINNHYLKKIYYNNNDISDNIKIRITEDSITNYSQYAEYRIRPQQIDKYQENQDYIYLLNIHKVGIIIPKKHFSEDEIEMIRKYYKKENHK